MARTLDLIQLLGQPDTARDNDWEQAFFHAFVDAKVKLYSEDPQVGPDGWPYIYVQTGSQGTEPTTKILEWLASRGIGLVVNPQKDTPDYVFPYGLIWNWKERRVFLSPASGVKSGNVELKAGQKITAGPPSIEYLPMYVRTILAKFLSDQGVADPRVLMISHDGKNYDLSFSLESLGSPPAHEHRGIAESLAWFLPHHYSIMLVSQKGLPEFTRLS